MVSDTCDPDTLVDEMYFPDMAEPTSLDLTDANASDAVGLVSRALASKYSDFCKVVVTYLVVSCICFCHCSSILPLAHGFLLSLSSFSETMASYLLVGE